MLRFLPLAALLLFGTATAQDSFVVTVDTYETAEARRAALAERVDTALMDCTPDTAEAVEWEELFHPDPTQLAANPEWLARCITVPGVAKWRRVLRDHAAEYEQARDRTFGAGPGLTTHIGLSGHEVMDDLDLTEALVEGRITGVLSQCEGVVMGGYCHYEVGTAPFIHLVHAEGETIRGRVRLVGDEVEADLGNLRQMSEAEMQASGLREASQRRADAIVRADKAGFDMVVRSANFPAYRTEDIDYAVYAASPDGEGLEHPVLWSAFFDPASPYRQPGYAFGERRAYLDTSQVDDELFNGFRTVCTCLRDSCEGEWPVSSLETAPTTAVPMVCEEALRDEGQPDWEFRFPPREYPDTPVIRRRYSP